MSQTDLRAKYGPNAFDVGRKIQGENFDKRVAERDSLDQHFTRAWIDFAINGMSARKALDTRTRLLVLTGQYTMAKSHAMLEDTIRAAVTARVDAREILEVVLQCTVYGGHTTVEPAIKVFHRVAADLKLLDELAKTQLPLDGTNAKRSEADERARWHADDRADPRTEDLVKRHGWLAVSRGLVLRPKHHLNVLEFLDKIDPEFAGLWVRFCYGDMYTRSVLDDKTRLLCMIGDCLAVGEGTQARGHMRGAMRNGASAREVLEVVLQTCVNFGMPGMLHALENFVQIMHEDGRLAEIGNPPIAVKSYAK
jgi:alkylhydroperoxidase/carboxymuconolactone decarboxylase family protein YurZ